MGQLGWPFSSHECGMHRSRLTRVVIDLTSEDFESSATFWSAAPGQDRVVKNERYESLKGRLGGVGGPLVGLQRGVDDAQRLHLDIETDNVEAEVLAWKNWGHR